MAQGTTDFARAEKVVPFVFPRDAGPHPNFQTEWWYYTGNVSDASGRHFGYELTFFRRAVAPPTSVQVRPTPASQWASNQIYFAHFAISDVASGQFYARERWSRAALGLAGAQATPYHVWIDDWAASGVGGATRLAARTSDGAAINLTLQPQKPVVLEGDHGLSRKSSMPGNASYYYSETRLRTHGTLQIGGTTFSVTGDSWLDREWSTSALSSDDIGWDWFALQLADGRDLMLYRLRRRDGSESPSSAGTLVARDGTSRALGLNDFQISASGQWRSPHSGITYPAGWRVTVPSGGVDVTVTPRMPDQELNLTFRYWEGAVQCSDGGQGYVELTGYGSENSRPGG